MNPPPRPRPFGIGPFSGLLLCTVLTMPGAAAAGDAERSILARAPVEEADPAPGSGLGPSRAQGDFAPLLAELATAAPDSAAAADATPAATDAPAAPATAARPVGASEETQPSIVGPVLGGIVGGSVGLFGGGLASYAINDDGSRGIEDFGNAFAVGLVSEVVLLPLGVHLGNASKGSFAANLGISAISSLAGIGLILLITESPVGVIAGAGLQVASVVYVERRVAARRIEARRSGGEPAGP